MIPTALIAVAVLAVDPPEWVVRLDKPAENHAFAIASDGLRFAVARDTNWIDIYYRGELENSVRCNDGDRVQALAFSPDGDALAAGCANTNQLRIWNVRDGQSLFTVATKAAWILSIAFHPQEPLVFCAGADGQIHTFDSKSGDERFALPDRVRKAQETPFFSIALAIHPSGRQLASGLSKDPTGHIWNLRNRVREEDFTEYSTFTGLPIPIPAFHRTGRSLLIPSYGSVNLVELAGRGMRWSHSVRGVVKSATWSECGRFVAVAHANRGLVEILDGDRGTVVASHPVEKGVVLLTAAGGRLVTFGRDDTVRFRQWPKVVPSTPELPAEQFDPKIFTGQSAASAFRTIRRLQLDSEMSVRLATHLEPFPVPSADLKEEVGKLVRLLADDDFEVRQRTSQKLRELVPKGALEMGRAAKNETDPEVLYRLRQLLRDATIPRFDPPVTVSQARWLELLERVNTPAARSVVERLTKGDPDAELTLDAIDTLQRMTRNR